MKLRQRWRAYWRAPLDSRPLALFRIAISLIIFADAVERLRDRDVFYSDAGIFPRMLYFVNHPGAHFPFAGDWLGPPTVTLWFLLGGVAAVLALGLGLGGRVPALLVWLYLMTINGRARLVTDGSDAVMQVMTFWLVFTRPDAAWSLRRGPRLATQAALPIRLLELQLLIVYIGAGASKLNHEWLSGHALFGILQNNDFARPLGMALLDHPTLCAVMTRLTLLVELGVAPLVLLLPRRWRVLGALFAAGLHLGIFALMRVGMFSFTMLASLCLFVPPAWLGGELPAPAPDAAPTPARRVTRLAATAIVALFVLAASSLVVEERLPRRAAEVLRFLGVEQSWAMFANGIDIDGYWSGNGRLADGTTRDVLADLVPVMLPRNEARFSRWIKLRDNMISDRMARVMVLDWICRRLSPRLVDVTLARWERAVHEPGQPSQPFHMAGETRWTCHDRALPSF